MLKSTQWPYAVLLSQPNNKHFIPWLCRPSWLVDKSRIATKIKCASGTCDPEKIIWSSNPTKPCPNCHHDIDNSDVCAVSFLNFSVFIS